MTIQELLTSKGLEENKNYIINEDLETGEISISPILSTRYIWQNDQLILEEYMPQIGSMIELNKEISVITGLKAQEVGAKVIARVWAINESKQLDAQSFNALMNDASLARIERLLWTGSLKTAKLLITALDDTYFSTDEKAEILGMINNSGLV